MFNLGGWEIALLVIAGLLFFGPDKLPQLMRQAGKIMHEIKKASNEFQYSIERELEDDEYRRQHRRDKKRRKKMKEAGLDPDAPATPAAAEAAAPDLGSAEAAVAEAAAAEAAVVEAAAAEAKTNLTAVAAVSPALDEKTAITAPAPSPETKTGS